MAADRHQYSDIEDEYAPAASQDTARLSRLADPREKIQSGVAAEKAPRVSTPELNERLRQDRLRQFEGEQRHKPVDAYRYEKQGEPDSRYMNPEQPLDTARQYSGSRAAPMPPPPLAIQSRTGPSAAGLMAPAPLRVAVEQDSDGTKRRKITNLREEAFAGVFRLFLFTELTLHS